MVFSCGMSGGCMTRRRQVPATVTIVQAVSDDDDSNTNWSPPPARLRSVVRHKRNEGVEVQSDQVDEYLYDTNLMDLLEIYDDDTDKGEEFTDDEDDEVPLTPLEDKQLENIMREPTSIMREPTRANPMNMSPRRRRRLRQRQQMRNQWKFRRGKHSTTVKFSKGPPSVWMFGADDPLADHVVERHVVSTVERIANKNHARGERKFAVDKGMDLPPQQGKTFATHFLLTNGR